jgi:hypothetical protein
MTLTAHDERFTLQADHALHPYRRLLTACPTLFEVG